MEKTPKPSTPPSINWMIARQFMGMLIIASLIAVPIAFIGMKDWLSNFAYQINIQWHIFVIAILATIFLTVLTTIIQSTKAALKNPVEGLKVE